jgi:hypothetical protein
MQVLPLVIRGRDVPRQRHALPACRTCGIAGGRPFTAKRSLRDDLNWAREKRYVSEESSHLVQRWLPRAEPDRGWVLAQYSTPTRSARRRCIPTSVARILKLAAEAARQRGCEGSCRSSDAGPRGAGRETQRYRTGKGYLSRFAVVEDTSRSATHYRLLFGRLVGQVLAA